MDTTNHQLWKAIHIIGKTFTSKDNDTRSAFICFFDCLGDLLPDENYRKTLKSFISQTPPEKYISSSDKTFQWTYELHSYANLVKKRRGQLANDISIEKALSMYENITKTDWGNSFWFIIHHIAANLPEKLSEHNQTAFVALIMCIRFLIPCDECRYHMTEYITKTNIYPFIGSGKNAFQYTWAFHNAVSERIKKNTMQFQEAYSLYVNNNVYSMIEY